MLFTLVVLVGFFCNLHDVFIVGFFCNLHGVFIGLDCILAGLIRCGAIILLIRRSILLVRICSVNLVAVIGRLVAIVHILISQQGCRCGIRIRSSRIDPCIFQDFGKLIGRKKATIVGVI